MREELISMINKEAGWGTVGQSIFNVTAAVGIARFLDVMLEHLDKKRVKKQKPEFYAKMLAAHPELKKEDPKLVARYWASLYHFAPYMAQDALASGAFIRQSIARGLPSEFGGPAPDTYLTLTDIEQKLTKGKGTSFAASAAQDVFKEVPGLLKAIATIPTGPKLQDNDPKT